MFHDFIKISRFHGTFWEVLPEYYMIIFPQALFHVPLPRYTQTQEISTAYLGEQHAM